MDQLWGQINNQGRLFIAFQFSQMQDCFGARAVAILSPGEVRAFALRNLCATILNDV